MSRVFLTTLLLLAIAVPAQPAVGPEQTVRSTWVLISGLVSTTSGFLLAWTEQAVNNGEGNDLLIQTIDAGGALAGSPLRIPATGPFASLGSDGTSTLLVWSEGKTIRGAWVGDRWASESFLIADVAAAITAISVAGNDGRFAIAWAEIGKAVHLATIPARGTAIDRRVEIAPDDALSVQIAAGADHVMVQWNKTPQNCPNSCRITGRFAYASWEAMVTPSVELYPLQGARAVQSLPGGNFAMGTEAFYASQLQILSPQSSEVRIYTRPWANPAALTLWRGNLVVLWERVLTNGSAGGTFLSVESDLTPTREPPPAFTIWRGPSVNGGSRLASSESLVLAAYVAPNHPSGTDARLVYRAVTPDDVSTLPARPDPPGLRSQTSGRETVDLELHTSGDWIEIEPLDNLQVKPRAFQRNQLLTGLPGDTLYSFRTFAENEQGFVPSSAAAFRTIAAFTPRAPQWLRTTDNLNGTWTIEWTDLSSNETSFKVLLLNHPANDIVLADLPKNSTKVTITAPAAGRIAIAAMNGSQASLSATGAAKPLPTTTRRRPTRH